MATTYDKASLVMIPSGYKDDKLYSIKPTDGSGDFTFSRDGAGASPATRVNASGLIEKGRENLLLQSNQFDTTWVTSSSSVTGGQSGYDGSSDAWLFDSTSGYIYQSISASGVHTLSLYVKAGTALGFRLRVDQATDANYIIDLSDGSLVSEGGNISYKSTSVGGGWFRMEMAFVADTISNIQFRVTDLAGTTSSGTAYIQDAQLESGLVATDYIETTTAPVSAGLLGDMPRLDYSGGATCPSLLLEPSRVNLFDHSEYMDGWSTSNAGVSTEENAITSPEGVVNAAKIKEDGTNAAHAVRQLTGPTLTSGTDYTFSFFAKKGERSIVALSNTIGASNDANCFFDLENGQVLTNTFNSASIEDFGNGWYRCIATDTADAADDYDTRIYTATADNQFSHQGVSGNGLYIYGLQLESGSYPTSYIPTYGSASVRSLDAPSISSGSSIFNDNEGTFFLEIEGLSDSSSTKVVTIGDGTSSNRLQIFYQAGTNITTNLISGGSSQVTGFTTTTDQEQNHKVLIKYASNNAKMYLDGTEIASDVSVTPPSGLNVLRFNNGTGAAAFEGEVKQLLYFDTALTDAECIALTTI